MDEMTLRVGWSWSFSFAFSVRHIGCPKGDTRLHLLAWTGGSRFALTLFSISGGVDCALLAALLCIMVHSSVDIAGPGRLTIDRI